MFRLQYPTFVLLRELGKVYVDAEVEKEMGLVAGDEGLTPAISGDIIVGGKIQLRSGQTEAVLVNATSGLDSVGM